MELKRDEIIKALECCRTNSEMDCIDCHYRNKGNDLYDGCVNTLLVDALSLIKELAQANEMLSESYDHLEKTKDELIAERSKLTEENERLRAELTGANKDKQILFDEIASLEAESEKAIDIAEGNIRAKIASGGTSCHWCEDKVKADTVRKMHSEIEARCLKGGIYPAFVKSTIDQIAKEMIGEANGN